MSSASTPKALGTRAIQVLALLAAFGVMFAVNRITPNSEDGIGRITAVGFLLLAGTLTSELFEMGNSLTSRAIWSRASSAGHMFSTYLTTRP